MAITIGRREFTALIGGLAAFPVSALAANDRKRPLIAWLGFGPRGPVIYPELFLDGLRELGMREGRDFDFVYRGVDRMPERLPQVAAELVQLNPDVIVAGATLQAVAASRATTTIPIVVPVLADPVGLGFATSDAHPNGNLTGIAPYVEGLPAKQLELAREIVPGAKRIGLLDDVTDPKAHPQRREIEAAAEALDVKIIKVEVHTSTDIGPAYDTLSGERVEVVIVEQSNMLLGGRQLIANAAAMKKLPSVYGYREHVDAGGLVSYGVNLNWCYHRSAYYVDQILKGAKPRELPIEFPTKIEFVINLKTAKALGLDVPTSVLLRADEVIE